MPGLRVIAGKAKGRRLAMVPGCGTRPISDRAKEALFNILGPDVAGSHFLDLFAGTGSVGIEALSRGAARVVFIDSNPRAVRTIHENLHRVGLEQGAEVLRADAFVYLNQTTPTRFDYVYIAPPQYQGAWLRALQTIDTQPGWLNPDAWVVAQIDPTEYQSPTLERLVEFDQRRYGTTLLCFYELPGE
ncbi:MAG: 16S rRNA (guanine(966)-N(2))-methyltransferase RsmD [Chloroflexota bacterium]